MNILILGGTAWLGRELATQALARGHSVTCLARGDSGEVADGATLVRADRSQPGAYDEVAKQQWGSVIEVSWQPGLVKGAIAALAGLADHWTYVSSVSAYADHSQLGADESTPLSVPLASDEAGWEDYAAAKVACENACKATERLLIARAGLIGGPGDHTGRSGYYVARAARDTTGPMLVPDAPTLPCQNIDVRDLSSWLLDSAERGTTGTFDTVGPPLPFPEWVQMSREVGGHTGELVEAHGPWLIEHGVRAHSGPESLPMWLEETDMLGLSARTGAAALAAGMTHRPRAEMLADTLVWEREQGLDRDRPAGLTAAKERELLLSLGRL